MRNCLLFPLLLFCHLLPAQTKEISGSVVESNTLLRIEGATVSLLPGNQKTLTNENGQFYFKRISDHSQIMVTSIGHESVTVSLEDFHQAGNAIMLSSRSIRLSEVTVSAKRKKQALRRRYFFAL